MSKPSEKHFNMSDETKQKNDKPTAIKTESARPINKGANTTSDSYSSAIAPGAPKSSTTLPATPNSRSRVTEIAFLVISLVLVGGVVVWYFKPWEPRHNGRTLSAWTEQLKSQEEEKRQKARQSLVAIGESAVPKVEDLLKSFVSKTQDKGHTLAVRVEAIRVLGEMGPTAAPAIPTLLSILKTETGELQVHAIRALGKIGSQDVIDPLVGLFESRSPRLHQEAVDALGNIGKAAVPRLQEMLKERTPLSRMVAVRVLERIGEPAQETVPNIIRSIELANENARVAHENWEKAIADKQAQLQAYFQALEGTEKRIVMEATKAVVRIGLPTKSLIPQFIKAVMGQPKAGNRNPESLLKELVNALGDADRDVRDNAALVLRATKKYGVSGLIDGLQNNNHFVRANAVLVLGDIHPDKAKLVKLLKPMIKDTHAIVRANVAKTLVRLEPEDADVTRAVVGMLDDNDLYVRTGVVEALGNLKSDAPEIIEGLIKGLQDSEARVRFRAAEMIGELGQKAKAAVPVLAKRLKAEGLAGSYRMAAALSQIGSDAEAATPALLEALNDDAVLTRRYAAEALGKIGAVSNNVVPALIKTLEDEEVSVVLAGVRSLGQIGPQASRAIPKLRNLQRNGQLGPAFRQAIAKSLEMIQE
ncbi:MAG: HEAT repeat domain-containing protein [Gemmataceae bacterium]